MPFTPSHAVVALPFLHPRVRALSKDIPVAIAVGAMTPDLPLFVGWTGLSYGATHAWVWLPATAVVAGALLVAWRCLLRPAVRELSPSWLARRLPASWDGGMAAALRETFSSIRGLLWLAVALMAGVATHIVWDSFTHEGRAGVVTVPLLAEQWGPLLGYKWLQYASSILGLAVLGCWALVWLVGRTPRPAGIRILPAWVRWCWWMSLPVLLVVAWVAGYLAWGPFTSSFTPMHLAYRVLPPASGAWGVLSLALALVVQALRRRRPVTPTAADRRPTSAAG